MEGSSKKVALLRICQPPCPLSSSSSTPAKHHQKHNFEQSSLSFQIGSVPPTFMSGRIMRFREDFHCNISLSCAHTHILLPTFSTVSSHLSKISRRYSFLLQQWGKREGYKFLLTTDEHQMYFTFQLLLLSYVWCAVCHVLVPSTAELFFFCW